jgi:hypothetical protein
VTRHQLTLVVCSVVVAPSGCRRDELVGIVQSVAETSSSTSAAVSTSTAEPSSTGSTNDSSSDSSSGSTMDVVLCEAPMNWQPCDAPPVKPEPDWGEVSTHALSLGCPGEPNETTPVDMVAFVWNDYRSWKAPRQYGTSGEWLAREGETLLLLTTGMVPEPDGSGTVTVPQGDIDGGDNGNQQGEELPSPIQPTLGSNNGEGGTPGVGCDGSGDCSDTLPEAWNGGPANELVYLSFDVHVPPGTHGWTADVAWFSAEFPERAQSDLFVWWQDSEVFTGNVATLDGQAMNVGGLMRHLVDAGLSGDAPELLGTGYEGTTGSACMIDGEVVTDCPRAAATGWLRLSAPAAPEETVHMTLALFDMEDEVVTTTVLVDRFRWDCEGCEPGLTCGLAP